MRAAVIALLCTMVVAAAEPQQHFATLVGCLPDGDRSHDLIVEWVEDDGIPRAECFGISPTWNGAEHRGTVHRNADGSLDLLLSIEPDPWVGGGAARVTLSSDRRQWRGTVFGIDRDGICRERVYPLRPLPMAQRRAELPGHPRLLFPPEALDELRTFAATDEGRDLLFRLEETCKLPVVGGDYYLGYRAAGMALIGRLTDRADALTMARELCLRCVNANTAQGETGGYAEFIAGIALTYDLAGSTWPDDVRGTVRSYLASWSNLFTTLHVPINQGAVPLMRSGHFQQSPSLQRFRSSTLLAALAILGEPVPFTRPEPRRPALPMIVKDSVPPDASLTRHGLPGSAGSWLLTGPFADEPTDVASLRPSAGQSMGDGAWRTITAAPGRANPFAPAGPPQIALPGPGRWLLHTAIHADQPLSIRWRCGGDRVQTWIAGIAVADNDVISLPAGDHAVTVMVTIAPGRVPALAPRSESVDASAIVTAQRDSEGWHLRHARWQADRDAHAASGGTWIMHDDALTALRGIARYLDEAHGETGWPPANQTADGLFTHLALATVAARQVLGLDLAPAPDDRLFRLMDSAWIRLPNGNGDDLYLTGVDPWAGFAVANDDIRIQRMRGLVQTRIARLGTRLGTFDYNDALPLIQSIVHHARIAGPVRAPHAELPRSQIDQEQASGVFRDRIDDQLAAFRVLAIGAAKPVGLGAREQAHAGAIALRQGHNDWLPYHRGHDDVYYGRTVLSVPSLDEGRPRSGAVLRHHALSDDGGGTLSLDLAPVYGLDTATRRDVAVAYPATGGVILLIADHWTGPAPWTWRLAQGQQPQLMPDGLGAVQRSQEWRCTVRVSGPAGLSLRWQPSDPGRYAKPMLVASLPGPATILTAIVVSRGDGDPGIQMASDAIRIADQQWLWDESGWHRIPADRPALSP